MSSAFDWTTLGVSGASVVTSLIAAVYARVAVVEARQSAACAQRDWKQRQWVDLYREADYAYDLLDQFQKLYSGETHPSEEYDRAYNAAMMQFRRAHAVAAVFPRNGAVDSFFSASSVFADINEAKSAERLEKILTAVQGIREEALLDGEILM